MPCNEIWKFFSSFVGNNVQPAEFLSRLLAVFEGQIEQGEVKGNEWEN